MTSNSSASTATRSPNGARSPSSTFRSARGRASPTNGSAARRIIAAVRASRSSNTAATKWTTHRGTPCSPGCGTCPIRCWRPRRNRGEIQLLEGQLEVAGWGRRRVFVAYSQDSPPRIEAFLIALPMRGGRSWSFEMYRHRPDAIRGVVPHLFHDVMMRMKEEGVESVSLCLLPGIGCDEPLPGDCALTRRSLCFGKKRLNFLFDFAGLYHFKSRFRPRYESRYICSRPRHDGAQHFGPIPHERHVDLRSEEGRGTLRTQPLQTPRTTADGRATRFAGIGLPGRRMTR